MVLKHGKFGVRSGNTFKMTDMKCIRQYRKQACIIRRQRQAPGSTEKAAPALGDFDVSADGVEFSLNKKGRWSLPEMIKDSILDDDDNDGKHAVQLTEYHKLLKTSNCCSFYSTTGPVRQALAKTNTYFNAASVKNRRADTGRRRRRNRRHNQAADHETEQEPVQDQQLRYDVIYPAPSSSSVIFENSKFIDSPRRYWNRWERPPHYPSHKRENLARKVKEELDSFDLDLSCDEDLPDELCAALKPNAYSLTLGELIQASDAENGSRSKHTTKSSSSNGSGGSSDEDSRNVHFLNEENFKQYHDKKWERENIERARKPSKTETPDDTCSSLPVTVILPATETTPENLHLQFGQKCRISACHPYTFIIDISEDVKKIRSGIVNTAFVVFSHDASNEVNTDNEQVYRVSLNMLFNDVNTIQIETIFDFMEISIEDTLKRTLFFIEILPDNAFTSKVEKSKTKDESSHTIPSFTYLQDCPEWRTESYLPDEEYLVTSLLDHDDGIATAEDLGFEVLMSLTRGAGESSSELCCICYEEIPLSFGRSLKSCGHWFCDRCWKEHLSTFVKRGALKLPCPEYECDTIVDPPTLISLINLKDVLRYAQLCHDNGVQITQTTKWCSDPNCGHVLKSTASGEFTVECKCGQKFCFNCMSSPHWPASCEVSISYCKKLRESGDASILPAELVETVDVHGKNCPTCHRFVEKFGGCPYMSCACGSAFCWGCGKTWYGNSHDDCYEIGYDDKANTTLVEIKPENRLKRTRRKWYKVAIEHRAQRHPFKVKLMKAKVSEMAKKLQHYVRKNAHKLDFSIEIHVPNKPFRHEAEKVPYLLQSVVDLYIEMNHIIEHTAVLMEAKMVGSRSAAMGNVVWRMNSLCVFIFALFQNVTDQNLKNVLSKCVKLRQHARKSIGAMVKCVKSDQV